MIDQLKLRYYHLMFSNKYLEFKRTAFQDWFGGLMTECFADDFLRVRLSRGDGGLDGYRISTKTVFQVFAPRDFSARELVEKFVGDLETARETLADKGLSMDEYVFVHNDPDDLPHEVVVAIAEAQSDYTSIQFRRWEKTAIWNEVSKLPEKALDRLFGPGPTMETLEQIGYAAIIPVIERLALSDPPALPPLELPDRNKLPHNRIDPSNAGLIESGRIRSGLVEQYLENMPDADRPEEIAEAYRDRYATLRDAMLSQDEIFRELWLFTGGQHFASEPMKIAAVTAVIAYFFDRCDIFENVPEST